LKEKFNKMKITSGACLAELQYIREQFIQEKNFSKFYDFLSTNFQLSELGDILRLSYALRDSIYRYPLSVKTSLGSFGLQIFCCDSAQ